MIPILSLVLEYGTERESTFLLGTSPLTIAFDHFLRVTQKPNGNFCLLWSFGGRELCPIDLVVSTGQGTSFRVRF